MSVEDSKTVDIIGYEEETGQVRMIMTEHRAWTDAAQHLADLATKLDAYIHYVDSGQLVIDEPDYEGRAICFCLYCHNDPPERIYSVFRSLVKELATAEIEFMVFHGPDQHGDVMQIDLSEI